MIQPAGQPASAVDYPRAYRWSGPEYDRAVEAGDFDDRRIELLAGQLYETSPQSRRHRIAIHKVHVALSRVFEGRALLQVQSPVVAGPRSRPEPDLAVITPDQLHADPHPDAALLIVEVSDAILESDRTRKAAIYAEMGVEDYWIVNLHEQQIEVHRRPEQTDDGAWRYAEVTHRAAASSLSPLAAPAEAIQAADLLP